jgi:site-specific DNA recombinase
MGEKQREHPHYLKSTVFCGQCGSRLIVTMSKNRSGTVYPYFICLGRHQKTTDCTQRAMLISVIEQRIEEHYEGQQLEPKLRQQIEAMLRDDLSSLLRSAETENRRLSTQKSRLTNERNQLLQAHYAGAVPLDLLKTEQARISRQLASIESSLSAAIIEFDKIERCLHAALDYAVNCGETYIRAVPQHRRSLNQAFFTHIYAYDDEIRVELAEPFATLLGSDVAGAAQRRYAAVRDSSKQLASPPSLTSVLRREQNKPAHRGAGLKETTLVPPA